MCSATGMIELSPQNKHHSVCVHGNPVVLWPTFRSSGQTFLWLHGFISYTVDVVNWIIYFRRICSELGKI